MAMALQSPRVARGNTEQLTGTPQTGVFWAIVEQCRAVRINASNALSTGLRESRTSINLDAYNFELTGNIYPNYPAPNPMPVETP